MLMSEFSVRLNLFKPVIQLTLNDEIYENNSFHF